MAIRLRDAFEQTFAGWREDVEPAWRGVLNGIDLGAGLGGEEGLAGRRVILCPHPAAADELLGLENPFLRCNRHLEAMGGAPIDW